MEYSLLTIYIELQYWTVPIQSGNTHHEKMCKPFNRNKLCNVTYQDNGIMLQIAERDCFLLQMSKQFMVLFTNMLITSSYNAMFCAHSFTTLRELRNWVVVMRWGMGHEGYPQITKNLCYWRNIILVQITPILCYFKPNWYCRFQLSVGPLSTSTGHPSIGKLQKFNKTMY